ncbi:type II and III secretion system protein family protein [Cupriavidus plantarum]|uniref:type II and III secretion system protein family protein n=1 Tax=Cupriavidus plantarum TaxID=942865 RepID=UPI000EB1EFD9|nr:type II and III secretion system protein family protein [Cupriavidus plantarum]RLK44382.1 pilus assembly protein CpaC [Cupriavidus plantarum]
MKANHTPARTTRPASPARCASRARMHGVLRTTTLASLAFASVWLASEQVQAAEEAAAAAQPTRIAATGPIQLTIGAAATPPAPADGSVSRGPSCAGAAGEPEQVTVPVGKSRMLPLPEPVRTRTLGNPSIVQAMLVSPQTLYVLGLDIGTTNMIVQGRSGRCTVIDVTVGADPAGLQSALHSLLPQARGVRVSAAADSLVLSGNVPDAIVAQQIMDIANAFVQRQSRSPLQAPQQPMGTPTPAPGTPGMMPAMAMGGAMGGAMMPMANNLAAAGNGGMPIRSPRIINMLSVDAPQQVMLEVKVAEVSKTLIDQLGAAANLQGAFGSWSFGLLANFLSGASGVITGSKANNLPFQVAIDAQKGDSLVKILAEPNLMAISGQEASFLAGGKVFIPVPQSTFGGVTSIVLQEETFGVGLRFTPTVLANGRINLKVAPEVSELSPTGVALTAPNLSGSTILPLINTRRASTTLQVMDGQSFAIGGLIKSNVTGSLKGLPGASELPILGNLFRSTSFQQDRSELLFVVTPRLVKPLPANYPMPTDSFGPVAPGEVFINGNMEGHPRTPPMLAPQPAPMPAPGSAPSPTTSIAPPPATVTTVADPTVTATPLAPPAPMPQQPQQPASGGFTPTAALATTGSTQ